MLKDAQPERQSAKIHASREKQSTSNQLQTKAKIEKARQAQTPAPVLRHDSQNPLHTTGSMPQRVHTENERSGKQVRNVLAHA